MNDAECLILKLFLLPYFQAAKQELERQRRLEWERIRRQELLSQKNREQEEIVRLSSKKKSLHLELEALVWLMLSEVYLNDTKIEGVIRV